MQAQRGNWRNFASPQVVLKKKEPARLARLQDGKPCWETWQAVNVLEIEDITIPILSLVCWLPFWVMPRRLRPDRKIGVITGTGTRCHPHVIGPRTIRYEK